MPSARIPTGVAAVLDTVLIIVFAMIGRQSHGESWNGTFVTAGPFLVGGVIGWLIWLAMRRTAPVSLAGGAVVWLCTVAGGMSLRALVGQGTAFSFIVVAAIATAVFLLGWRLLAMLLRRRAGHDRRREPVTA